MIFLSRLALLLCIVISPLIAGGSIEELSSTEQLLGKVNPTISQLFIFDIDNTLYHPKQMLGSDEWFWYFSKKKLSEQGNSHEVLMSVVRLWQAVQTVTAIIPIEKETASVIQALQQKNCFVMAMTNRGPDMATTTLRHLSLLQIDMRAKAPAHAQFQVLNMPDTLYNNGILFTNNRHKGSVLVEFLQQIQCQPSQIIYINDMRKPLEEVSSSLPDSVQYVGLRYSGADHFVHEFSPAIADKELERFTHIMSDSEAA
jgi:hypothetical protein